MSKKSVYESHKTECLVIRFEEGILTDSTNVSSIRNLTYDEDELSM